MVRIEGLHTVSLGSSVPDITGLDSACSPSLNQKETLFALALHTRFKPFNHVSNFLINNPSTLPKWLSVKMPSLYSLSAERSA
ncbi:hypothetical protein DTO280E4_3609 [Paecilomyces variotii]|nr:hypothetical protein DTO280E4_3609 [Paecilomyces variotii]KAJ9402117.1 hypothetical protein DTO282F9_881 [Paecilomyces variotii]KAJ9405599.1 hypothetical protein DTO045G8_6629 [Paecilomyces variotii]